MLGEDYSFERPIDALTLSVILGTLVVSIVGLFVLVESRRETAHATTMPVLCSSSRRASIREDSQTVAASKMYTVGDPWRDTCPTPTPVPVPASEQTRPALSTH